MSRYLYMRLSGPMQSWGSSSLFWHRGTEVFPTKSGVLGLLFCAMGRGGAQAEALAEVARLPQMVLQVSGPESNGLSAPLLTDFHMVGGGYDENDPWQLECIPKTSEGKKAVNGGAKLTRREYLQNVNFVVIQAIPATWKNEVEAALIDPVWDIYLGRKCCSPSLPVYGGIFDSEREALARIVEDIPKVYGKDFCITSIWREASFDEVSAKIIRDVPLRFGKAKLYAERAVVHETELLFR